MHISYKAARVNAGLTQEEAAARIGVSVATISRWETGMSIPSARRLGAMSDVYGVPVQFFFPAG